MFQTCMFLVYTHVFDLHDFISYQQRDTRVGLFKKNPKERSAAAAAADDDDDVSGQ